MVAHVAAIRPASFTSDANLRDRWVFTIRKTQQQTLEWKGASWDGAILTGLVCFATLYIGYSNLLLPFQTASGKLHRPCSRHSFGREPLRACTNRPIWEFIFLRLQQTGTDRVPPNTVPNHFPSPPPFFFFFSLFSFFLHPSTTQPATVFKRTMIRAFSRARLYYLCDGRLYR